MDLVSTIRKDGKSRGGAGEFSWDNVKDDKHRENYLGHSLKAPTGRWQKGKDLTWWSKGDGESTDAAEEAERERLEEIRKLKEAEQNAMYEALGFKGPPAGAGPGMPTAPGAVNPNLEALGVNRKAVGEKSKDRARSPRRSHAREDKHRHRHRDSSRSRSRERRRRDRDRNRSRSRDRDSKKYSRKSHRSERRSRSRSRSRDRRRERNSEHRGSRDERRQGQPSRERAKEHRRSSRDRSRERPRQPTEKSQEQDRLRDNATR